MIRPLAPLPIAFACALAVGTRPARAEARDAQGAALPAAAKASDAAPRAGASLRGFDLLASVGWGAETGTILNLELAPYGASFGIDSGYTWPMGFRLGGYFAHSLGHTVLQHRDPRIGREYDFSAETSSINGGLSVGWDVPVYALRLRYTLSVGVTSMRWKFQETAAKAAQFGDGKSPTLGMHFAPGVALLWPYRWFEAGLGFAYLAQAKDVIPSGFIAELLVGVRL